MKNKKETTKTPGGDHSPSMKDLSVPSSLLERLWVSYSSIYEKRQKTFYYLYSVMVVLSLIWISKEQKVPIHLLDIEVELKIALYVAPAFISILTIRYLYLCAYTEISYVNYLGFYQKAHQKELIDLGIDYRLLNYFCKLRDLTEKLNLYSFPIRTDKELYPTSFFFCQIVNFLLNIAILLSVLIPLSAYIVIIFWIGPQDSGLTTTLVGKLLYSVYILMGIGLMFLPIHFYYIVKFANKKWKSKFD
jgi:hypothetical protein